MWAPYGRGVPTKNITSTHCPTELYESYVEWREGWRERMNFPSESAAGRYRRLLRA